MTISYVVDIDLSKMIYLSNPYKDIASIITDEGSIL